MLEVVAYMIKESRIFLREGLGEVGLGLLHILHILFYINRTVAKRLKALDFDSSISKVRILLVLPCSPKSTLVADEFVSF